MSTLADRQRVEIQRCFDAFDSQFREWHARVEKPQWAMHYTQVHAATALLNGFRESIRADGAEALDEVEGLVLSAWRVWEAFRSRLSQRQEEMFVSGLQAADEIAWACRKPMVEAFAEAKKTMPVEPPLTCLHGSTSPTALVRHIPFSGEGVESAFPSEYSRRLLQALPFPIISLPWHELFHAPGMVAVAHETGHVVERDCGLEEAVWAAIQPVTPPEAQERWKNWRAEIFADFYAMRHCGAAFAGALADLLLTFIDSTPADSYPPFRLRIELCLAALELARLPAEAAIIRDHWKSNGGPAANAAERQTAAAVVKALDLMPVTKDKTLGQILPFGPEQHEAMLGIKKYLSRFDAEDKIGDPPATSIAAAAWLLFRDDPAHFADEAQTDEIHHLILRVAGPQGRRGTHSLARVRRRAAQDQKSSVFQRQQSKAGFDLARSLLEEARQRVKKTSSLRKRRA